MPLTRGRSVRFGGYLHRDSIEAVPSGAASNFVRRDRPRQQLTVPAGTAFPLLFENREGAPHNVTIYDEGSAEPLFVGEIFSGPGSRT